MKNIFIILFFLSYFILGMIIIKDYGISWDEPTERFTSLHQYKFAVSKLLNYFGVEDPLIGNYLYNRQMLHGYPERYYGTFLHWPLLTIEYLGGFKQDVDEIFYLRHINNFVYFFIATIALYLVILKRFKSKTLGILAVILLLTSPRIFAESFYNNKDILFASCVWIGMSIFYWFTEKQKWVLAILLGIWLGLTINTRIMGLMLLPIIGLWLGVDLISRWIKLDLRDRIQALAKIVLIEFLAIITYLITSPTSWGNELTYIPKAFNHFSHYGWQGKSLYLGNMVPYNNIPWHFLPVLLWATTPISYTLLFATGLISHFNTIILLLKKRLTKLTRHRMWEFDFLISVMFFAPIISVIALKSVVYESWRHVYFVYFPFIYLCILGLYNSGKKFRKGICIILTCSIVINVLWMIKNHPYQYLYFNPLVRAQASKLFERDYWGVVSVDMVNYILATDSRPVIKLRKIDFLHKPIEFMVRKDIKNRFEFVDEKNDADYISHLYHNTQDTSWHEEGFIEIKRIEIDGNIAQSLYKKVFILSN